MMGPGHVNRHTADTPIWLEKQIRSFVPIYQFGRRDQCRKEFVMRSVGLEERVDLHVVFFQAGANDFEGFVNGVGEL
jgi:hypothetical protein